MLDEELRDFLINISILRNEDGSWSTLGLSASITFHESTEEVGRKRQARESILVQAISKLRLLKAVTVKGTTVESATLISERVRKQAWDAEVVYSTIRELLAAGDGAFDIGHHGVAERYYSLATQYTFAFIQRDRQVYATWDDITFMFLTDLRRSRNWIEEDEFIKSFEHADSSIQTAEKLLGANGPVFGGNVYDISRRSIQDRDRQSFCDSIKAGAAKYGERIKCEDVGRAYYYKSLAGHCIGLKVGSRWGLKAPSNRDKYDSQSCIAQAYEDRLTAIACFNISETTPSDSVQELHELAKRTMERQWFWFLEGDDPSKYADIGALQLHDIDAHSDDGDAEWEDL